jgi:hypothetical protein
MAAYPHYNPFADNGSIVYGQQFVGRKAAIKAIQQRIIDPPSPGCLAIVGAPRIGKSSLVYETLIYPQESLLAKKIISFRVNLPDVANHVELFQELLRQTLEVFSDHELEEDILIKGKALLEKQQTWVDLQHDVRKFFKKVKGKGWRVVAVIDEFDEARHIFQDGVGFQALRELAYQPAWRVCLVTVSRRSLSEITSQARTDISNLPGIFKDETLGCFTSNELEALLRKLEDIGLAIDDRVLDLAWTYTGGHPFLASALAFELAKLCLDNQNYNPDVALQHSTPEFLKYYDSLVEILKEDGSLEKLLQILFGPLVTATQIDADRLKRYGLLKLNLSNSYNAFSTHFEDYLKLVERTVDLWPLWRDTEKRLRLAIDMVLQEEYHSEDWISKVEVARPKLKTMLEQCRQAQEKERKSFGGRASANLLDFTYPSNLYEMIAAHWNIFEPIFKKDKNYWAECFKLLAKLRNPMAHLRDEIIETHDRQKAEGYCNEILHLLNNSLKLS